MPYISKIATLAIIPIIILSCASSYKISRQTMDHMVALQGDGTTYEFVAIKQNRRNPDIKYDYHRHVHEIMQSIQKSDRDSLLIIVHGGMKDLKESVSETQEQTPVIESTSGYYPLYINWESSMMDAYWEQLVYIRQGKYSPTMGPISAPFYLVADFGRAIVRAPITWGHQGYNLMRNTFMHPSVNDTIYIKYSREFYSGGNHIYLGQSDIGFWDDFLGYVTHVFPGLVKIITTPLLDTFGKSAWQNMNRRTQKLFRRHDEFNLYNINAVNVKPSGSTGGASVLMDSVAALAKKDENISITLIGHSMGCGILAEIIMHYSDLHFENIILMAPAMTIKDFEHIIVPYLQKPENKNTNVYILTLHPEGDDRENTFYDVIPRGSLLDWVDDFASEPTEFTEVTLGKWKNIIRAAHIIPEDVRGQIYIKGFGYNNDTDPQLHGDFNDLENEFWKNDFWEIKTND
jgi:pimeloyl-ACP methyl ester carboxylesterase